MTESDQLMEHFFRHEYSKLVSLLTRAFGVSRIDLVEDMVGTAIFQAMNSWKKNGIPDNPAGWIHKVSRNLLLDVLRREKNHRKAIGFATSHSRTSEGTPDAWIDSWLDSSGLPDSELRLMFVCCHPLLDRVSQISLTLKLLGGFSVEEISRGLLMNPESVKKKIQRAKSRLAEAGITTDFPARGEAKGRLSVVHDVLYLMFNEGYSASRGTDPIRDDVCEEAVRLQLMLCNQPEFSTPESRALLALMLFHASRLESRTDSLGEAVLLEDQDRNLWDRDLIDAANRWLIRSNTDEPSRFHLEAVIASLHCSAKSLGETDWATIAGLYETLGHRFPSPVYQLNGAIALAQSGRLELAASRLNDVRNTGSLDDYVMLDCAEGYIQELSGDHQRATDCYLRALGKPVAEHQRIQLEKRLSRLNAHDESKGRDVGRK